MDPKLVVEASCRGVEGITIRVQAGGRTEGLQFLRSSLPAIQRLSRQMQRRPSRSQTPEETNETEGVSAPVFAVARRNRA